MALVIHLYADQAHQTVECAACEREVVRGVDELLQVLHDNNPVLDLHRYCAAQLGLDLLKDSLK